MIQSIFGLDSDESEYELNAKSKSKDNFKELIQDLDALAQDDEIDFDDSYVYIAFQKGGIEITGNYGEEPEDEDDWEDGEDYGNVYFYFDHLGNFIRLEKDST